MANINEVIYLESVNCLLVRSDDGSLIMIDSSLENFCPLAVAHVDPKTRVSDEILNNIVAENRLL